ncbi:hypothetical protein [Brachyspira sp.]|uniref:hypothetical protein n=1 Tax=Brachyspira sp. TaxID=1977261 RepID=UPI003D7C884B
MKKLLILLSILFAFISCNNDITKNKTITISGNLIQGNVTGNLYFDIDNGNRDKYYMFTSESDIELLQNYVNKHLTIETEYKSNYYVKIFRAEGVALFNVKIIESSEPTRLIWLIGEVYMDPNQWVD